LKEAGRTESGPILQMPRYHNQLNGRGQAAAWRINAGGRLLLSGFCGKQSAAINSHTFS
jgi:hypothetical protein